MKSLSTGLHSQSRPSLTTSAPTYVFWGASTGLTGNGAYRSFLSALGDPVLAFILASAMTLTLTVSGITLFRYAGMQSGKRLKPASEVGPYTGVDVAPRYRGTALSLGVVVLLVSSWFSFSSLVFLWFGDDLQRAMNEEIQAPWIEPIRTVEAKFARIEQDTGELARVAAERSSTEAAQGGQCVSSPPGQGRIADMISDHSTKAAEISAMAKEARAGAVTALTAIRAATSQDMVAAAYPEARALIESGTRYEIRREAQRLYDGYNGAGFSRDGRTILCPRGTAAMLPALKRVLASVEDDIAFPTTPPVFRKASIVDSAVWQLRMVLSAGETRIPGVSFWYIALFGLLALSLDTIGATTAHFAGRLRGAQLSKTELERFGHCSAIMEDFLWDTPSQYLRTTGDDVIRPMFDTVLVMPNEGDDKETEEMINAIKFFVSAYDLKEDRTRAARHLDQVPQEYGFLLRRLQRRGFSGNHIDIYTADDEETWDLIREHRRQLRLLFGQHAKMPPRKPIAQDGSPNIFFFRRRGHGTA
ncbi:MAG: hypothetical protein AAFY35_12115 [Pseudomonadota bacterium]